MPPDEPHAPPFFWQPAKSCAPCASLGHVGARLGPPNTCLQKINLHCVVIARIVRVVRNKQKVIVMRLSTGQAAERLGVARGTILNWIKSGHIKAVRVGPKVYKIDIKEVERLLCK